MKVLTEMTVKKIAGVTLVTALAFSMFLSGTIPAQAQTSSQLQAQIQSLLARIAQLEAQLRVGTSGGSTSVSGIPSGFTFTRTLNLGSSGTDVLYLQKILNSNAATRVSASGAGSPGMETMYFGPATQSAVKRYQELYRSSILTPMGLSVGTGVVGPSTRTHLNLRLAAGIPGVPTTPDDDRGGDLEGGAGSISDADYISGLSNEEVGEDEEDVEVAGLEIEADDGSDIEITAVRLNFTQGTADEDFEDVADEVSVWLDGEEFAREDASEFSDDDDFDQTVSLDDGAIIRSGETGELTVAITGTSNIDSQDVGDTWTVEFENIRFEDADGASITENGVGDINDGVGRTFSFETFAGAAGVELKIRKSDDSPDGQVIDVDNSDDTDDVEMLIFTFEAEGSDIEIKDLPITLTATGANVNAIANTLRLEIDGDEFSENVNIAATSGTVTFEDIDFVIDEGDEVEVTVLADINNTGGTFGEGDTLKAELTSTNRDSIDAEDESGEDLENNDKTGTALGDEISFSDTGIRVTFVSATETVDANDGADDDTGTFVIKYRVEAVDGTIFVSDSAAVTTASSITAGTISGDGTLYRLDKAGTAVTEDLSDVITFTQGDGAEDSAGGNIELEDGESAEVTLTVAKTNNGDAGDNGLYRVIMQAIGWNTNDSSTFTVYDFDLEDFKTDPVNLN